MIEHDNVSHGTPEVYREYIAEILSLAQIQANLGCTYATVGDDTGLEYTLRRLMAYVRAAVTTLRDLKAMREADHAR